MKDKNKEVKILIIDDDSQICYALKALFLLQGWKPLPASEVSEGLQLFKSCRPDLVLIDYHMPGINGVEGVRMLRKLSVTVPIIVFTIDESQAVADAFLDAGASDFALKPIKAPDIVSRIRLHLRMIEKDFAQHPDKGISQSTLDLIEEFMASQTEYLTVNQIADKTGLAYQTAYRYLQYLIREKRVEQLNIYGKIGRPKQLYKKI